jgi:hypothetical protein
MVSCIEGVAAIDKFAAEIDRLNSASARPNPFLSAAFLRCYALRSEYHEPGKEERLFVIQDGERVIGCAPMRKFWDGIGHRYELLATLDTEEPGLLSAPEDQERVAQALVQHLCSADRRWGMVEFAGQPRTSSLYQAAHAAAGSRFRVRDIAVEPYNEIALVWPDLAAYFQSLVKKMRSNISRQARRLFAHGECEIVIAEGGPAVSEWFEAYLNLEARSWKHGTSDSIERHPRRVRFYRDIVAGNAGLDPEFIGVVLDGVLIAGILNGSNASSSPQRHGAWSLEMAFDQSRADLGPGQLLLLLSVGHALEKKHSFLNFMQNFAYYKHRWAAAPIDVANVQIVHRFSAHNLRASMGELRARWRARKATATASEDEGDAEGARPEIVANPAGEQHARETTQMALANRSGGLRRLDRAALRTYLPFNIE